MQLLAGVFSFGVLGFFCLLSSFLFAAEVERSRWLNLLLLIWLNLFSTTQDKNHYYHILLTFPIPLVGEGAGETGTKSTCFGDDDFSKSLSLCK